MDNTTSKQENQAVSDVKAKIFPVTAPDALKNIPRWVLHKGKIPFVVKRKKLSKVNAAKIGVKFLDFDEALAAANSFDVDGLGFALDKSQAPLVCIDIDGGDNPFLQQIISEVGDTYIEKSPSGVGCHVWYIDSDINAFGGRRIKGLEIYAAKRFLTFTGNAVLGSDQLAVRNGLTDRLLNELFDIDTEDDVPEADFDLPPAVEDEVLTGIIANSKDERLKTLLEGNAQGYVSASEEDWHAALKLAFWSGGNAGQIERIISNSKLGMRHKWQDRQDYRRKTISKALVAWDGVSFKPAGNRTFEIRQGDSTPLVDKSSGAPIKFITPRGYVLSLDKGIFKTDDVDDNVDRCISNDVILPLRLFVNADSMLVSNEIWFRRHGKWHQAVINNDVISNTKTIVELSALGLDVTSINARALVAFLRAFKAANRDTIPVVTSFAQTGWRNDGSFVYPINSERYVVDAGQEVDLVSLFEPHGDRETWLNVYNSLKQHQFFRLAVAAALAAPLLKILKIRNMTLQFWSQSGQGKTAILQFADSVFKNPLPLFKLNASPSSIEARCLAMSDFPVCVDELKMAEQDRKSKVNKDVFVHFIEGGASRGRATKDVHMRGIKQFRTIAIMTDEAPLTGNSSAMGVKRRILEIHSNKIFPDGATLFGETPASFLHHFTEHNYALVGREWIDFICKSHVHEEIIALYRRFQQRLVTDRPDAFVDHCNLLAACATADFFFNREIAESDSEPNSEMLFETEQTFSEEQGETDCHRAFKSIVEWLNQNHGFFVDVDHSDSARAVTFGWIANAGKTDEAFLIIPRVLKKMLQDDGFSPRKVLNELADEHLLDTQYQKGRDKPHYSIVQSIKGVGVCRVVKIRRAVIDSFTCEGVADIS